MNLARSLGETFERVLADANSKQPLMQRWAEILAVPEQSPDIYLALTTLLKQLMDLAAEIQAANNINDRAKGLYVNAVHRLIPMVNPAMASGNSVNNLIHTKDSVDMLFLVSDSLPERLVPDVQSATLEELCKQLDELKTAALGGEIPPDIKQLVITSVDTLLMALRSYGLFGPQGVARIYGAVAAELARASGDGQASEKARSLLQRTMKTVKTMGAVVVWAGATVTGAHEFLTHAPEVVEQVEGMIEAAKPTSANAPPAEGLAHGSR